MSLKLYLKALLVLVLLFGIRASNGNAAQAAACYHCWVSDLQCAYCEEQTYWDEYVSFEECYSPTCASCSDGPNECPPITD